MKYSFLAGAALAAAALSLSACGSEPAETTEAAPEGMPGVEVSNARLVLPAVTGNPGVLYFDLSYSGDKAAALRGVDVAGAKTATMHQYVDLSGEKAMYELLPQPLQKGQTLKFEPGANHIMLDGLADTVTAGSTVEATLIFAGGDKFSFPAEVRGAGEER